MEELREAMWEEYELKKILLTNYKPGSDEYGVIAGELDSLRKELLDLDKTESDHELKRELTTVESNKEDIRNKITIVTFAVTTLTSLYAMAQTFKFDEFKTVTSTLGRSILNGFVPKRK